MLVNIKLLLSLGIIYSHSVVVLFINVMGRKKHIATFHSWRHFAAILILTAKMRFKMISVECGNK